MQVVVTVQIDPIKGPIVAAFGPWDALTCERERRRMLADFAYREPWASAHGGLRAFVVPVRDEKVAP
jgi:uncharacterized protein YcaQ